MEFEWHPRKALDNQKKHGVSFAEAATVFRDPLSATLNDSDHSTGEERFLTIGRSTLNRLLFVSHTARRNVIRIISARKLTPAERRDYEEHRRTG